MLSSNIKSVEAMLKNCLFGKHLPAQSQEWKNQRPEKGSNKLTVINPIKPEGGWWWRGGHVFP